MKFVTVRDFRSNPAQIWRDLKREYELIVTHNGKPIGLLTPISSAHFEETLADIRQAHALSSLRKMRQKATEHGLDKMSPEAILHEIKASRKMA